MNNPGQLFAVLLVGFGMAVVFDLLFLTNREAAAWAKFFFLVILFTLVLFPKVAHAVWSVVGHLVPARIPTPPLILALLLVGVP